MRNFEPCPGEDLIDSLTPEQLMAWENAGAPSVGRTHDAVEAQADERQNLVTSLNFPLHWTTANQVWQYLFDVSIACELLAPRPDDLVLDLAAGTCWVTELLTRLGIRTVSIDLSTEMMRRGRERLTADSRLQFREDASFVAARSQALPFRDESFDGIVCMNALHHLPSYRAALEELFRVVKPGGRAVFSEPGMAHAEQPLSQFRMREETVIEKNVSLPAIRRLAVEIGFSRMRVVPLRSPETYAFDYTGTAAADAPALEQLWEDTLRHAPREHARFVLQKGGDRPADTWLPPHQLTGRLRAEIAVQPSTSVVRVRQPFVERLRIGNTGSVTWKAAGRRFGGQVTAGLKLCDLAGNVLREDLGRTPLLKDVAPGECVDVDMAVAGLPDAGRFVLRYDMVVEGVTWFEFQGSTCPKRQVDVIA